MHLCQWLSSPENANSSKMYIRFYPAYIICNFTVRFRHFNSQSDERSLSSAAGYSSLRHCSAKQQRHTRQTQTCKWNTLKSMFLSLCFSFFILSNDNCKIALLSLALLWVYLNVAVNAMLNYLCLSEGNFMTL